MLPDPPAHSVPPGCPSGHREILARIGNRWSLEIIGQLRHGPVRFNDLRRGSSGISQRMLTLTLRGLERDGLVGRTISTGKPPRVDYHLTELGLTLMEPVRALIEWTMANQEPVQEARVRFDETHGTPAAN